MTTIKPFTKQDGYTIFDNTILDYIMPSVSGNAWKVLCLIIRKTRGWQKESDEISFSQIRDGAGIKTNHTVARAVDELEQAGYILVTRGAGDWDTNTYALNLDYELDTSPPSAKNALDASAKNALDPVQKLHTQNKVSKQSKEITTTRTTAAEKLQSFYLAHKKGKASPDAAIIINDILDKHKPEDIIYAVEQAILHNIDTLVYVISICNRRASGQPDEPIKPDRSNGTNGRKPTEPQRPQPSQFGGLTEAGRAKLARLSR